MINNTLSDRDPPIPHKTISDILEMWAVQTKRARLHTPPHVSITNRIKHEKSFGSSASSFLVPATTEPTTAMFPTAQAAFGRTSGLRRSTSASAAHVTDRQSQRYRCDTERHKPSTT